MELLLIIAIFLVAYLIFDIYWRFSELRRRFRVVLFLLEATHKALADARSVSREAIYDAEKKTLYSMPKNEMRKTRKDLAKEGIVIENN